MTDLLLVGGPSAGRHLHATHSAKETLYTITANGTCRYQHASTVSRGGEVLELYICENLTLGESARLIAAATKSL